MPDAISSDSPCAPGHSFPFVVHSLASRFPSLPLPPQPFPSSRMVLFVTLVSFVNHDQGPRNCMSGEVVIKGTINAKGNLTVFTRFYYIDMSENG